MEVRQTYDYSLTVKARLIKIKYVAIDIPLLFFMSLMGVFIVRKYTKEWLEELCANSYSYAEVLKKAGRKQAGGSQNNLKKKNEYALLKNA